MTPSLARALALGAVLLLAPDVANAAHVVAMREGTRTVVSIQPEHDGPLEDFAIELPVAESFRKESVRTLSRAVLERLDRIDAPRLVELRETDPCQAAHRATPDAAASAGAPNARSPVRGEAAFSAGEYAFSITRAKDAGTKLLVVHVDPSKVTMDRRGARTVPLLSPLRFHFDEPTFRIPLDAIRAGGRKDVVVHVLGRSRYEAAALTNVFVPTNIEVVPRTIDLFSSFYAALFDQTLRARTRAVVTEYAKDPAPVPLSDLLTLGADVLPSVSSEPQMVDPQILRALGGDGGSGRNYYGVRSFTLTRLHLSAVDLGSDLFLKAAPMEEFEARYLIRHAWSGPLACDAPVRGAWVEESSRPALDVPSAARDVALGSLVAEDGPAVGPPPTDPPPARPRNGGCNGCAVGAPLAAMLLCARRRERR